MKAKEADHKLINKLIRSGSDKGNEENQVGLGDREGWEGGSGFILDREVTEDLSEKMTLE